MPHVTFTSSGSFDNFERSLKKMGQLNFRALLEEEAKRGRQALARATPRDSGIAAASWGYQISQNRGGITITWTNTNVENGFPVVVALQYGYGTGTGGYVQGRDFINPAMRPIFDSMADRIWKAVTSA
jgi:hypothetical protein